MIGCLPPSHHCIKKGKGDGSFLMEISLKLIQKDNSQNNQSGGGGEGREVRAVLMDVYTLSDAEEQWNLRVHVQISLNVATPINA